MSHSSSKNFISSSKTSILFCKHFNAIHDNNSMSHFIPPYAIMNIIVQTSSLCVVILGIDILFYDPHMLELDTKKITKPSIYFTRFKLGEMLHIIHHTKTPNLL